MSLPTLRIGVTELRRRVGNRSEVHRSIPLGGLAVSTAAVPEGAEATVDVTLESLSDGVTAHGSVEAPWTGECRRCLEMTSGTITAEVDEVFKDDPDEGETLALTGETIDLGPVIHDAVILALPLAPLCREGCPGPEPEQFPVVAGESDDGPDEVAGEGSIDPRWAALGDLRFDSEDDE